ncbi:fluoride efflux transporter FluC [Streptomyces polyrhachis]|uniref:Fluoride-specific ion channel FluC n=1 Tax=Streptomyces polyrhachis TaxID=1282885 RepID=A0ABW2GFV5_9ACTN
MGTGEGGGPVEPVGPVGPGIDPDVDLHRAADRAETAGGGLWRVLAAVSVGGALGALARYGAGEVWPAPWGVLGVNVLGCALIGVLMVLVTERGGARWGHPLLRPFLGTGVLGGFTTFSAYAADVVHLLDEGRAALASAYAGGTLAGGLGAVWAGAALTRRALRGSYEGIGLR